MPPTDNSTSDAEAATYLINQTKENENKLVATMMIVTLKITPYFLARTPLRKMRKDVVASVKKEWLVILKRLRGTLQTYSTYL